VADRLSRNTRSQVPIPGVLTEFVRGNDVDALMIVKGRTIVEANQRCAHLYGCDSKDELAGLGPRDIFHVASAAVGLDSHSESSPNPAAEVHPDLDEGPQANPGLHTPRPPL